MDEEVAMTITFAATGRAMDAEATPANYLAECQHLQDEHNK